MGSGRLTGGAPGTLWSDENIPFLHCGGGCMTIYICQYSSKCIVRWIIHMLSYEKMHNKVDYFLNVFRMSQVPL